MKAENKFTSVENGKLQINTDAIKDMFDQKKDIIMENKFAFVKDGKLEIDIEAISKARERVIDVPKALKIA